MRAIFLVLILANLAFFAHQHFLEKDEIPAKVATAASHNTKSNLQLLSELGEGKNLASPEAEINRASVKNEANSSTPNSDLCTMLGPYAELLQAEFAVEHLQALGAPARITQIEIQEGESFWVYLRPEMSDKEALRRLYELQAKNIESHVITKGDLANGISFGRFADYAAAEVKLNEIKGLGYDAAIKRLPKTIQETWVVVDSGIAEKVDTSIWAGLLEKQFGLEKRQNFCLGVASQ